MVRESLAVKLISESSEELGVKVRRTKFESAVKFYINSARTAGI